MRSQDEEKSADPRSGQESAADSQSCRKCPGEEASDHAEIDHADLEQMSRASMDALPVRIAVLNEEGRILATNRSWRSFSDGILSCCKQGHEGENFFSIWKAADGGITDAENAIRCVRSIIAGEEATGEFEYTCQLDDEEQYFRCKASRFMVNDDVRIALMHEDITESRRARQQAESNEKQFQELFEFAPDAIVMTDHSGVITLVNKLAEDMFGYERSELIGRQMEILLPQAGRRGHVSLRQKYVDNPTPSKIGAGRSNLRGCRKNGTVFPVDVSLSPLDTARGQVVVAAVRDVSQRVQAEQQMSQALATLDAIEDAAFVFEPEGLGFTYVNQGAVRQLGYSTDELLGMRPSDITPAHDEDSYRRLLAELDKEDKPALRFTTEHQHKDGQSLAVEISLQPMAVADGERRFIAIARDIGSRMEQETKERRTQRLESIGTLAGGVAHDLNNTFAPILMSVEMLRTELRESGTDNEEILEYVDMITHSTRRGADMVGQLLTFAKGAEGDRMLIQIRHQLKDVEKIIRNTFDKQIRLQGRYAKELPIVVGDATQIHQVLLNLCVNARDAMPSGGTLRLEAEPFTVDSAFSAFVADATPGEFLRVVVRDTGTGIPAEIVDKIFDPFFTTKGPEKGTGLGLSTVVGIIKSHGGFLRVHSTPGEGSQFEVYLPAAEQVPAVEDPEVETELRGNDELILVVDDEAPIRKALTRLLKRMGFNPITAVDGTDALIQFGQHRDELKLIITDINMPAMDGITLIRTLQRSTPDTPIIVMTGLQDQQRLEELSDLGVIRQLSKPFSLATVTEAMQAALKAAP